LLAATILLAACQQYPATSAVTVQAARAELRDLITDVAAATAYRYRATDDLRRWIGPLEIVRIPEAATFAGVNHTMSDSDGQFHVQLATSSNLMDWTWQIELARRAPTVARMASSSSTVICDHDED
jgi:hypothetical protein